MPSGVSEAPRGDLCGGASGVRTRDLLTASQALIPAELWPHARISLACGSLASLGAQSSGNLPNVPLRASPPPLALTRRPDGGRFGGTICRAGVAELVDARDSKSRGPQSPCRFDSGLRHQDQRGLPIRAVPFVHPVHPPLPRGRRACGRPATRALTVLSRRTATPVPRGRVPRSADRGQRRCSSASSRSASRCRRPR